MRRAALLFAAALAASGCDVALQDVRVLVWQPKVLAESAGDLLDDATALRVQLDVDGEPSSFTLTDGRSVGGRVAAPEGSDVRVTLRSLGTALPDGVGRSGVVHVAPGEGAVDAPLVLAPPARVHTLTVAPDARADAAACSDAAGRLWIVGGEAGGTAVAISDVLVPLGRAAEEGPTLPARTRAGCAADGAGGVLVLGGCAADGTPVDGLWRAAATDGVFTEAASVAGACDARLLAAPGGGFVGVVGARVAWITAELEVREAALGAPRYGAAAGLLGRTDEGAHVLLLGGFSDAARTMPAAGATAVRVSPTGELVESAYPHAPACVGAGRAGGLLAVDGEDVVELAVDGTRTVLVADAVPGDFVAGAVSSAGLTGFVVLSQDGAELLVVPASGQAARVAVSPARPGAALVADPGGAVRLAGGGVAGVAVVVVD